MEHQNVPLNGQRRSKPRRDTQRSVKQVVCVRVVSFFTYR